MWHAVNPSLGGDYTHFLFSHIAAYVSFYGGLSSFANQSVERNHRNSSKYQERKTRNGGGTWKGATHYKRRHRILGRRRECLEQEHQSHSRRSNRVANVEEKQSKELLTVLLTTKVLRAVRLSQQIRLKRPFPSKVGFLSPYYPLCGFSRKDFPIANDDLPDLKELEDELEKHFCISEFSKRSDDIFFTDKSRNRKLKIIHPEWVNIVKKANVNRLRNLGSRALPKEKIAKDLLHFYCVDPQGLLILREEIRVQIFPPSQVPMNTRTDDSVETDRQVHGQEEAREREAETEEEEEEDMVGEGEEMEDLDSEE